MIPSCVASELWVKWNQSLVSIWKQSCVLYSDQSVDMIVWAKKEKFAHWEQFLPVPKIRLRCNCTGEERAVTLSALPLKDSSVAGPPAKGVPVFSGIPAVADASDLPHDVYLLAPSLGSDWSGFDDELAEPFSDLPPVEPLAPPRATLNTSHKRARSPDLPTPAVQSHPSSSPHPAAGCQGLRPTR